MKVLIVDDQKSNRQILSWILEELGHESVEADNGKSALEQFSAESPDLVLMDVLMPVMDGYEATRQIKKLSGIRYVPVIFLTGLTDEKTLIKCLESGGDDFLSKPVDEIVLQAKMNAHSRTRELNEQVRKKNDELTYLHNRLQQEHSMGEHVLSNAMKDSFLDSPNINHFISPVSLFNGDLLLVAPKPSGGLYVFLGDFTGHGLAASIGAIPVSQAFYAMTAEGVPLTEMVRTLNDSLCRFLPDHMFCAATILELNQAGDMARVWSGGLPDGIVLNSSSGIKGLITSKHMPLGILEGGDFEDDIELIKLSNSDSVFLYTDGIIEGVGEGGVMFGEERLHQILRGNAARPLDVLVDVFHQFKQGSEQEDDISIVQIMAVPSDTILQEKESDDYLMPWNITAKLHEDDLRTLADPVAQLFTMFPKVGRFKLHSDVIRNIFSEMFSNALEHGVLGLSSAMKDTDEGFLEYYSQRAERLESLVSGYIAVKFKYSPKIDKNKIYIEVSDSGAGFDVSSVEQTVSHQEEDLSYGRGLSLIRSLASEVAFSNNGSTLKVQYDMTAA